MRLINIWDAETTGKLHKDHRIIELSMRLFNFDTQQQVANYLWRFDPERNIDAKAFAVHHISRDDLKGKPLIKEVLPSIVALLEKTDTLVHHNGDDFDVPFLEMECERNGFVMPKVKTFDTMKHGNFATDLGKSPSLGELCWCLDIDYDPEKAHAGDYDTEVLANALFKGINDGWWKL